MNSYFDYDFIDPLDDLFVYLMNPNRIQRQENIRLNPDRYFNAIQNQFNRILKEEFGFIPYSIESRAQQLQEQIEQDAADHSATKQKIQNEINNDANSIDEKAKNLEHLMRIDSQDHSAVKQEVVNQLYNESNIYGQAEGIEKQIEVDAKDHSQIKRKLELERNLNQITVKAEKLQEQMCKDAADHSNAKSKVNNEIRKNAKTINAKAQNLERLMKIDANDHSATKQNIVREAKEKYSKANNNNGNYSFISTKVCRYNGKEIVEEKREQIHDTNGTHYLTKRRIGDRYYQVEGDLDENGNTSDTKEIWHNVPTDEIEQFNIDWANAGNHGHKAINHKKPTNYLLSQ